MAPNKNVKISEEQKNILLDFMMLHSDFAAGRLIGPLGNMRKDEMWDELSLKLNATGTGASKLPAKWKATWTDWKNKVKGKAASIRNYVNGTGGGKAPITQLTLIEEKLISLMGSELATGDINIPEYGFETQQIPVHFDEVTWPNDTYETTAQEVENPIADMTDVWILSDLDVGPEPSTSSVVVPVPITPRPTAVEKNKQKIVEISNSTRKRRPAEEETAYDRAAENFRQIAENRQSLSTDMQQTLNELVTQSSKQTKAVERLLEAFESHAAVVERQTKALEVIAGAKKLKYGLE